MRKSKRVRLILTTDSGITYETEELLPNDILVILDFFRRGNAFYRDEDNRIINQIYPKALENSVVIISDSPKGLELDFSPGEQR